MSDATQPTQATEIAAAVTQVLGDSLGYLYPAALRVALRTDIAGHLTDGPKTAAQLAELTGVHAPSLHRVLRFLATRGIFREDTDSAFHLTPAAHVLRTDVPYSVRPAALLFTDEMYWKPAGRLEDTVRDGSTAFNDIFGAPLFDHLQGEGERERLFTDAMDTMSMTEQNGIVASYDFPQTGTVIDLAGGLGGFLRTLLARNPGLRGVLFERESVLRRHKLDDPAIEGRWETAVGDFFEAVPPGADFYVLKRIIHDKSDADSVRILRTVRNAMSERSRLLIVDAVRPDADISPSVTISDVLMLTVFDGQERSDEELEVLLSAADLKSLRVISTPGTLSIVEVAPV
ncbi:SAM-dependent methyltransferase [Streptomyces sp. ISL-96]|uniref:methyltransferase n=1 Tax=Streptomyces sp. ISL-96 TaxID=2819191 RepID=UPI001BECD51B|nr:methyltransferase [Streptomyces sp. ISL-96]MBT2488434.1 SAM-dependent methyltransferase [Streptomyces sp. ISL-96]